MMRYISSPDAKARCPPTSLKTKIQIAPEASNSYPPFRMLKFPQGVQNALSKRRVCIPGYGESSVSSPNSRSQSPKG